MSESLVDPVGWSTEMLVSLGDHVVHELAQNATAIDVSYRVLLGRCLLAVEQTKLYQRFGCSGAVHYGTAILGLGTKHARNLRRVARELENLPRLSRAAEKGEISWGKLREIVGKASPETEDIWLALAKNRSDHDIQRLVRATERGKLPWENAQPEEPDIRLQLHLTAERGEIFERARASLSQKLDQPISIIDALEHLVLEHLAGRQLSTEIIKNAKLEARRGASAAKRRHAHLVEEARELAENLTHAHNTLEVALGLPPSYEFNEHSHSVETTEVSESQKISTPPESFLPSRHCGTPESSPSSGHYGAPEFSPLSGLSDPSELSEAGGCSNGLEPEVIEVQKVECPGRDTREWRNPRLRYNLKARGATPAQRRELLRRDGHCCSTPGCPNRHWLHLHHLVPFARKGSTSPENLIALCSACHKNYHDGHLRIEGSRETWFTFRDAQGRDLAREYKVEVAGWINFWLGWNGGPEECYIKRWAMVSTHDSWSWGGGGFRAALKAA